MLEAGGPVVVFDPLAQGHVPLPRAAGAAVEKVEVGALLFAAHNAVGEAFRVQRGAGADAGAAVEHQVLSDELGFSASRDGGTVVSGAPQDFEGRFQAAVDLLVAAGQDEHAVRMPAAELGAQRSTGEWVIDVANVQPFAKLLGRNREAGTDGRHVQDEGRRVAALMQQPGEIGDYLQVVAVLAATRHDTVDLSVADQGIEGAHELGAVLPPAFAKGGPLLARVAPVVHPRHAGRPRRFEMRACRTRHQSKSANVCKP